MLDMEERIAHLTKLFQMDGKPYLMSYEYRKSYYKKDKPALDEMLKRGLIEQVSKTTSTILFRYIKP